MTAAEPAAGSAPDPAPELMRRFANFARDHEARAPLYARLARYTAAHPHLASLLNHAPESQRSPVLLLAAVHDLLLDGAGPQLARHYPNLGGGAAGGDPTADFARFVAAHEGPIAHLLATRQVQTNEIGRCALLLPALAQVATTAGPVALLDVGASAGLTLLLDRYAYRYRPGGRVGTGAPLLTCGIRGPVPVPRTIPVIAGRLGLDHSPLDVHDPVQARWLAACVWPEQSDRFANLRAALELARAQPTLVRRGDAVDDLEGALAEVAGSGHPVVTTTWALAYLSPDRQADFAASLERIGTARELTWLCLESPDRTAGLGLGADPGEHRSVLHRVSWRAGRRRTERLAVCHPHGYWMHWEPSALP